MSQFVSFVTTLMGNGGSAHRTEDIDTVSHAVVDNKDIRKVLFLGAGETGSQFKIKSNRKGKHYFANKLKFYLKLA